MLNFGLTEEQEMLRREVRAFAEKEIAPQAKKLDDEERFSVELVRRMAELGLFGVFVSKEYGGAEMDYLSYIVAVEELARCDASHAATVAAGNSLGIGPLYYFGNEEQKRRWLPKLCRGESLAAFGLTEPGAGSDAGASRTTAVRDGDDWVINGQKIFITNAATPISDVCIVQAVSGKKPDGRPELSCFLVPSDSRGFVQKPMHQKMMWRASATAELYFDDCRVPATSMLGKRGEGMRQMMSTLDRGRLSIAAMALGGAQGAFDLAMTYGMERKQFGRPVANFQVNAFKLADAATRIDAARLLLYRACWLCDEHRPFSREAAMAKLYASEVFRDVAHDAQQLHGGYGLMKEYAIERFFRDERILEVGEGTSEILHLVIARHLGLDPVM